MTILMDLITETLFNSSIFDNSSQYLGRLDHNAVCRRNVPRTTLAGGLLLRQAGRLLSGDRPEASNLSCPLAIDGRVVALMTRCPPLPGVADDTYALPSRWPLGKSGPKLHSPHTLRSYINLLVHLATSERHLVAICE